MRVLRVQLLTHFSGIPNLQVFALQTSPTGSVGSDSCISQIPSFLLKCSYPAQIPANMKWLRSKNLAASRFQTTVLKAVQDKEDDTVETKC